MKISKNTVLLEILRVPVPQPTRTPLCSLRNLKAHYRIHNSQALIALLSQTNPVHAAHPASLSQIAVFHLLRGLLLLKLGALHFTIWIIFKPNKYNSTDDSVCMWFCHKMKTAHNTAAIMHFPRREHQIFYITTRRWRTTHTHTHTHTNSVVATAISGPLDRNIVNGSRL
jgi:hypothetical protein